MGETITVISILPNYCEGYDNINRAPGTVLFIITIFVHLKKCCYIDSTFSSRLQKNIHFLDKCLSLSITFKFEKI